MLGIIRSLWNGLVQRERPRPAAPRRKRISLESLERRELLASVTTGFGDTPLAVNSYYNGPDPAGTDKPDPFGGALPVRVGTFGSGGAAFSNTFNPNFGSWSGFALSSKTDNTTAGFTNQFSSYAGTGAGDTRYAVASGYVDAASNLGDPATLAELPHITLPKGASPTGVSITNATYAALSMRDGDAFAKKFGGATGNDPDWFKLSVYGTNAAGSALANSVEFYLADYRFADNAQDYIVQNWAKVDLTPLSGAEKLYFNVSSSDVGSFGLNTPAAFALDNLSYSLPQANRAPVLDNSGAPTLTSIDEDTLHPPGTSVQTLLAGLVTDADASAKSGIAIVGTTGKSFGRWEYSFNAGNTWIPLGNPSPSYAKLLPADAGTRVRFIPQPNIAGKADLVFHAWDRTRGTHGSTANLVGSGRTGGSTPYSAVAETASQPIRAINDLTILAGVGGTQNYGRGNPAIKIASAATLTDIDSTHFASSLLEVEITSGQNSGNRLTLGGAFSIDAASNLIRRDPVKGDIIIGSVLLNSGSGKNRLSILFNGKPGLPTIQSVIRNVLFSTTAGAATGARTIRISFSEAGAAPSQQSTQVTVQ